MPRKGTTVTYAEELVDGGGQHEVGMSDWKTPVRSEHCGRSHRGGTVPAHPGFSFCRDCLAWLRCEIDDDPLDDSEQVAASMRETTPEMWVGFVEGEA